MPITEYHPLEITSASLTINIIQRKCSWYITVTYPICRSVWKVYCGKTANRIWMPSGVVIGVGRGMGVLDGVVIVKGKGTVLGVNLGCPIVTIGDGDALFPNYFGENLFYVDSWAYTSLQWGCCSHIMLPYRPLKGNPMSSTKPKYYT